MAARDVIDVPFDGVMMLPSGALRCFVATDGTAYVSSHGLVRAVTGEALTTWDEFCREVIDFKTSVWVDCLVRVRPARGPEVEAVLATVLDDVCVWILEKCARATTPTDAQCQRAMRAAQVLLYLQRRGAEALARRDDGAMRGDA